jgi:hypothetical protein
MITHFEIRFQGIKIFNLPALWMLYLTIYLLSSLSFGQTDDRVQAGKKALEALGRNSWYDPDSDDYRVPDALQPSDAAGRTSKWEGGNRSNFTSNPNPGGNQLTTWWGSFLQYAGPVIVYGGLGLAIIAIIVIAIYYIAPEAFVLRKKRSQAINSKQLDMEKLSDLPFTVEMKRSDDPLSEVQRCMQQGDFDRAMIYLFAYELLQLDSNRFITIQRGKTNRVYLRELRQHPALKSILESTILGFEDVFFGRYRISQDRFMIDWKRVEEFHRYLQGEVATVAAPKEFGVVS